MKYIVEQEIGGIYMMDEKKNNQAQDVVWLEAKEMEQVSGGYNILAEKTTCENCGQPPLAPRNR